MYSKKRHTRIYLWFLLLGLCFLPHALWADSTPSTPAVTSIVLPQAYRVLCDTDPALRPAVLKHYIELLTVMGQSQYQPFFQSYKTALEKIAGAATGDFSQDGPRYPVLLKWIHPVTHQEFSIEAYVWDQSVLLGWRLIDPHNPSLQVSPRFYSERELIASHTIEKALQEFLRHNPYPAGNWEVDIRVPGQTAIHGVFPSQTTAILPHGFITPPTPALQFQDPSGAITDCVRRFPTSTPYAITELGDPKLVALMRKALSIYALIKHPLQRGALLTYLEPTKEHSSLTEAVVFVDPKTFAGYLVPPAVAPSLQAALTDKDPKRVIDKLYELKIDSSQLLAFTSLKIDSSPLLAFSSYEDLSKRFFYNEVFSKESVLDPKKTLDLREQKGWEQWRKDADKELSDINGLVVQPDGCIQGKRGDGKKFEVCGTVAKKSQSVTFYQKTQKGKKALGHAQVGQTLHSHRGALQDAEGHTVAYLPLASDWMFPKLYHTVTLLIYSLPQDAFQAVADVFSFGGLWDLAKSVVKSEARKLITRWFGAEWFNDLWRAANAIKHTYDLGKIAVAVWKDVSAAKDEHQLYEASDHVRPAVQALVRQALQGQLVARAQQLLKKEEAQPATEAPPPAPSEPILRRALPGPKAPKGLLTTREQQEQVDELIVNTHDDALLTEANARALLTGPTPTSTYELTIPEDEHGVEIVFQDNGKAGPTREVKSVEAEGEKFTPELGERLEEGARDKGEDGPRELVVQVPAGQDVAGALQHFRDDHEGKKWLARYKDEPLTVVDPAHKPLYQGPVVEPPLVLLPTMRAKLQDAFRRLQVLGKSYKGLSMVEFEKLLQQEWLRLQTIRIGSKSLRDYTGVATIEEYVLRVQKGLEEVVALREASAHITRINPNLAKIDPQENVSFADVDVEGHQWKMLGLSARDVRVPAQIGGREVIDPTKFAGNLFQATLVGTDQSIRDTDGEYRIFEAVAQRLGGKKGGVYERVKGTISLFSERAACTSCTGVLEEFQKMFPNIQVQLNAGPYKPKEAQKE